MGSITCSKSDQAASRLPAAATALSLLLGTPDFRGTAADAAVLLLLLLPAAAAAATPVAGAAVVPAAAVAGGVLLVGAAAGGGCSTEAMPWAMACGRMVASSVHAFMFVTSQLETI
jgi:hypothetical protein